MHMVANVGALKLRLESTLQELPLWKVNVELNAFGSDLIKPFKDKPLLPGIILTNNGQYVGMISRRRFFEHMSRPFSLELFLNRPIKRLLNNFQIGEEIIFSEMISVMEATQRALGRSPDFIYEPIIVKTASGEHTILDFHQLLLAYSQIHVLTIAHLQKAQEQTRIAETDLHEFRQNYIQLVQNEKKVVLGQVLSGFSGEINNRVNFLSGNLIRASRYIQQLLELVKLYQKHYPEPATEIQTAIKKIELECLTADLPKLLNYMKTGIDRIKQFVHSLRNFSTEDAEKKAVDIHELIDSTLIILQSRFKSKANRKNITVIKEYGNLPLVMCYPGELNQVFMNILTNAIDALEELSVIHKLSLIYENKPLTNPEIRIHTELADSNTVVIRIADNGAGMSEEVKQRIFDPLFTTKPVGKGTGLGLSISYQTVVEKHKGTLQVNSVLRQGSEFVITIPN